MWWCVAGEQEIDLMAMHGVNIMYAHTGAEHVQAKVWTDLLGANATRGIDDFYTGPGEKPIVPLHCCMSTACSVSRAERTCMYYVCLPVSVYCCRLLRGCLPV